MQCCQPGQWITRLLPLTVVPSGEVPAALTLSGLRVAAVAMTVTMARPALREAPEARQAVGALAAGDALKAVALAGGLVAEGADGAAEVAVAGCRERSTSTVVLRL